jgi:hypothetical protein
LHLRGFSAFVTHFHVGVGKADISQVFKKSVGRDAALGFEEFKDALQNLAF